MGLKYLDEAIVLQEIPDEITLALNITNCPHRCINCHSPYLRENIGNILDDAKIKELIIKYPYITCICFMGGDSDHLAVKNICQFIKDNSRIKCALYSGDDQVDTYLIPYLDYYKVGSYKEEYGPLNEKTTNQRLYKIEDNTLIDITYKFW